jgi:hypothetical protein
MARPALTNPPTMLPLGGKQFLVAKWTMGDRDQLEQFVRANTPRPLAVLNDQSSVFDDPEIRKEVVRRGLDAAMEAEKSWPPPWGSPEFFAALQTPVGQDYLLFVILRAHQPGMTIEACADIRQTIDLVPTGEDEAQAVFSVFFFGEASPLPAELGGEEEPADPKAPERDGSTSESSGIVSPARSPNGTAGHLTQSAG